MKLSDLPAIGGAIGTQDAGIFAGLTTTKDGTHCAIVLLADKPEKLLTWKQAMNWAKKLDAELPTRPVAAALFAHLRDQFELEPLWHWTSEAEDGSHAWGQYFDYGYQYDYRKSDEGRARAVRLIQLTA